VLALLGDLLLLLGDVRALGRRCRFQGQGRCLREEVGGRERGRQERKEETGYIGPRARNSARIRSPMKAFPNEEWAHRRLGELVSLLEALHGMTYRAHSELYTQHSAYSMKGRLSYAELARSSGGTWCGKGSGQGRREFGAC